MSAAVVDLADARAARGLEETLRYKVTAGREGAIFKTLLRAPSNVNAVLRGHKGWAGLVAYDAHEQAIVLSGAAPWGSSYAPGGRPSRPRHVGAPMPWTDGDSLRLQAWMLETYAVDLTRDCVDAGLQLAAEGNRTDPPAEYLEGLVWDGVPRLGLAPETLEPGDDGDPSWLSTYLGVADSPYSRRVGRWFLISAVARILDPGCKVDHALVLEGPQSKGKSSAVEALFLPWYADTPLDLSSKDRFGAIQGVWGYELAEFDAYSRHDAAVVKAFATSKEDKHRPPYARRDIRAPRRCVFIATINPGREYLQDATGGRRWWPVRCGDIDLDSLRRDRAQLFAEAVAAYRAADPWYPRTPAEHALCGEEQEERRARDPWEGVIAKWIPSQLLAQTEGLTTAEVLEKLNIEAGKWGRIEEMRAGEVLRAVGWERRRVRDSGGARREYRYFPKG